MDLITVIIPYFKKKNYIKEAVLSAINQSYQNLEIIIVYDDENQNDLEYIKKIKNYDKRIELIINTKTLGAGMSRNKAIEKAKGNYISFLDADDIWKKNKVETQIEFMKKNNFRISHTSYDIIDHKNKIIGTRKAKDFNKVEDLLKSCDIGLSTVLLQKKIFINNCNFPNLKTKEDFVLWLKILKKEIKIGSINQNLTSWRKLNNSLSSSLFQKLLDGFYVYNKFMQFNFIKSIYYLLCLSINFLKKN